MLVLAKVDVLGEVVVVEVSCTVVVLAVVEVVVDVVVVVVEAVVTGMERAVVAIVAVEVGFDAVVVTKCLSKSIRSRLRFEFIALAVVDVVLTVVVLLVVEI